MPDRFCLLCEVYNPAAERLHADRAQTDDSCRRRLERDRLAVRAMYLRLIEQERPLTDDRVDEATGTPRDPVASMLPMAVTPGRSRKPNVSGTRERLLPINVTVVDLTAGAQVGAVEDPHGDQTGLLSVATVLYEWARAWHEDYFPCETPPAPTAVRLLDWMAGVRLEIVAESDPGIADFARELNEIRRALRSALGENAPRPVVMWGVPCRRCDTMSSLVLDPEDPDRYRECTEQTCRLLMTEVEYKSWLIDIVEGLRREHQDSSHVADGATV